MNILVSIIIPIYNSENYLQKCLNSVCNQTYKNIEIILVDDGSTDNSGKICDDYARSDDRIKVLHKSNGGLVSARKTGLKASSGEYIMPVDSDDWIDVEMTECMLSTAVKYGCEMVQCGMCKERDDESTVCGEVIREGFYDLRCNDSCLFRNLFMRETNYGQRGVRSNLCSCMFKRSLIYEWQMAVPDSVMNGEDDACYFPCILSAQSYYKLGDCFYHYRCHGESMTKSKKFFNMQEVLEIDHLVRPVIEKHFMRDMLLKQFNLCLLQRFNYEFTMFYGFGYMANYILPDKILPNSGKIVVYGAGNVGKSYMSQLRDRENLEVAGWVDKQSGREIYGQIIKPVSAVTNMEYDVVLLAALHRYIAEDMKKTLEEFGIDINRVIWTEPLISATTGFLCQNG